MKKLKYLFILLVIMLLCGCYREESTITINKDKSVDFEIKVLVEDNFDEKKYIVNSNIYDDRGVKIQRINEYGHKGYKINKHYINIDDISSDKDTKVEIFKYLDLDFKDNIIFKVESGYFKDVYTADFIVDYDYIKNNLSNNKQTKEEFLNEVKEIYNTLIKKYGNKKEQVSVSNNNVVDNIDESYKYKIKIDKSGNVISFEVSNLKYKCSKESDKILIDDILLDNIVLLTTDNDTDTVITFVVNTPRKAISNNATRVSEGGKTLTWVFDNTSRIDEIKFVFDISNNEHYVMIVGFLLLAMICFMILIVLSKNVFGSKKRKIENTIPVYTGYDESIEDEALKERNNINKNIISVKIKDANGKEKIIESNNNCEIIEIDDEK